ncbi:MAG: type I 3-dehydroquinate dehydratase [Candidatus Hydrogenedens sp.]|nr:type I 3-dehydroquinate dehydratase [Candidatus Hydrogenedens sp.]
MYRRDIGTRTLGVHPTVAVAVNDKPDREILDACMQDGAHVVELRIDQFAVYEPAYVVDVCKRFEGLPRLATIRASAEGGNWSRPDAERVALYRAVLPHAEAVDCELGAACCGQVVTEARKAGVLSIASYHHFSLCPSLQKLQGLADRSMDIGADVVKIAAHCATPEEMRRLARFTLDQADRGVIVIGMGSWATASRIFFPALGSLLTYTFLGIPTAPGQLNCEDTIHYLSALYPEESGQS